MSAYHGFGLVARAYTAYHVDVHEMMVLSDDGKGTFLVAYCRRKHDPHMRLTPDLFLLLSESPRMAPLLCKLSGGSGDWVLRVDETDSTFYGPVVYLEVNQKKAQAMIDTAPAPKRVRTSRYQPTIKTMIER